MRSCQSSIDLTAAPDQTAERISQPPEQAVADIDSRSPTHSPFDLRACTGFLVLPEPILLAGSAANDKLSLASARGNAAIR
jgi:hypothetical protein